MEQYLITAIVWICKHIYSICHVSCVWYSHMFSPVQQLFITFIIMYLVKKRWLYDVPTIIIVFIWVRVKYIIVQGYQLWRRNRARKKLSKTNAYYKYKQ